MQAAVSKIHRMHSAWRWLCPIQSRSQLLSVAVILLLGLPAVGGAAHVLVPAVPLPGLLLCSLAGAMPAIYAALPGKLEITSATGARELASMIVQCILSMNHVHSAASEGASRFVPRGPRCMRWDENTLALRVLDDRTVRVEGPVLTLYAISKWFERARSGRTLSANAD